MVVALWTNIQKNGRATVVFLKSYIRLFLEEYRMYRIQINKLIYMKQGELMQHEEVACVSAEFVW